MKHSYNRMKQYGVMLLSSVLLFTGTLPGQVTDEEIEKIEQAMPETPRIEPEQNRRVLVFSRHEGYEHESIQYAKKALDIMAEKTGAFRVDHSTDMKAFRKRNLRKYDAIIFNNTTQLKFENERFRRSLMSFIKEGKGIVGIHAASDNFYNWPEAAGMMGGLFDGHPWTSGGTWGIQIVDPDHALTQSFDPEGFRISDEIYRIKEPFSRENLRVLVALDMDDPATRNAEGVKPSDTYIPISWVRDFGEGRLFYCSFGHNAHIYWNTPILQHYLDGIQFALGDLDADTTPTLAKDIASLRDYDYGMSREALTNIQDYMRKHINDDEAIYRLEQRMLDVLRADGTLAGKQFAAEQLRIIGGPESVTVLNEMLQDEETSDMARYALEKIDHPAAGQALRDALENTNGTILVGVINSIGNRQDAAAVEGLTPFLDNQDRYIYSATLNALGEIGNDQALANIEKKMKSESGVRQSDAVTAYLSAADKLEQEGETGRANDLYGNIYDGDYPVPARKAALNGLIQTDDKPDEVILSVLLSDDQEMQTVAIRQVGQLRHLENIAKIASMRRKLQKMQQIQLLAALGTRGNQDALGETEDALQSNQEEIRIAALEALASVGDAKSAVILAEYAATHTGDERETARESLYLLDADNTDQTILANITQVDPDTRLELIMSIDDRQINTGTELLLETAQSPNPGIRIESLRVLANVAHPNYLSQVLDLLGSAQNDTERGEVEKAVTAIALQKPENSNRAEEVLTRYESAQNNTDRAALIRILGNIGAPEGLSTIRRQIENSNQTIKLASIRALSAWPNSEPAPDLLKVAKNARNNTQKILALRGYVNLLGYDAESEAVVDNYREAMDLAPNTNEQRMVLSGLSGVKSVAALNMAAEYLDNASLKSEAEVAVVQISQDIYDEHPQETKSVLEKVVRSSNNSSLAQEAKEVLAQLN